MKKNFNILLFLLCLIFCYSCKTKKKITKENNSEINNAETLFNSTQKNYLEYENISIKFSVNYYDKTKNQNLVLGGNLRILKNQKIWISLRAMGFPVAGMLLTKDSLKIIDKFNKKYFSGNYDFLSQKMKQKLDFATVQAILTNEFFIYPQNNVENIKNYMFLKQENNFSLSDKKAGDSQAITIKDKDFKISEVNIENQKYKKNLYLEYKDFKEINKKKFPQLINIFLKNSQTQEEEISINLNFKEIKINKKGLKFPFKIPAKYRKM